ncbi:MAG: hypothetical protein WDO19_24455 [Bacteroidota bacterium]
MNTIIQPQIIVPILLLLLQSIVLLFVSVTILRSLKILKVPYAGMEYSQIILASAFIFGILFISSAGVPALFQSFKIFQNRGTDVIANTFSKFSQFFLIIVFFEIIYSMIFLFLSAIFTGNKKFKDVEEGNIPVSLLVSAITISFAILIKLIGAEIVEWFIPEYISIR